MGMIKDSIRRLLFDEIRKSRMNADMRLNIAILQVISLLTGNGKELLSN